MGKRKISAGLCLMVLCLILPLFPSKAEEEKVIRVGVEITGDNHVTGNGEGQAGYNEEFLREIAKYTGWKYEFVEGTRESCLMRLQSGAIDILGGVPKNRTWMRSMDYSDTPSVYITNYLLTERDSNRYAYEDFEKFDGMRIGALRGDSTPEYLEKYGEENNFSYVLRWYGSEENLQEAMKNQEVDAIYLSDFQDLSNYEVIARFGYTPFYYVTNVRRAWLKDELDQAMKQIHTQNHYYESELYNKYFTKTMQVAFTKEEKEYIREHDEIEVLLFEGFPLICEYNKEQGEWTGIIIDALRLLSKRTGFQFTFKPVSRDIDPWDYLAQHHDSLIAPLLKNNLVDYGDDMKILDTIVAGRMVAVSKNGKGVNLEEEFFLAIPEDMYNCTNQIQKLFPNAHVIAKGTHQDGLDMVEDGIADITLLNEIAAAYMLQSPYYENLSIVSVDDILEDITIAAMDGANPLLLSILNKGIATFSERDTRQIVIDNTASRSYEMSRSEWFYHNRLSIFLAGIVLIGGAAVLAGRSRYLKKSEEERQRVELAETRYKADQEYKRKMFYQANFDRLTGLYNQNYFVEKANELMRQNPDTVYSFFRLNIVKFKMINEIFGKERGDIVLIRLADKLRADIGSKGLFGRGHSDNFVICYPVEEARLKAFPKKSTLYLECMGQNIRVEIHAGIYVNSGFETDAAKIMEYVQIALQNKNVSGSDHFHFYQDSYLDNMLRNQKITNEMETALNEEQFKVFLQPQFDHITGVLVGAEALVRWFHPKDGMIPPNSFIPVFEGNRFINKLDAYICEKVCVLLQKWQKQGRLIPVSVNLSRMDLQDPELIPKLQGLLEKYAVPVKYLHLEITESAYVENNRGLVQTIEKLREAGFIIEMDDFGSGYSSLNMLKDIPVDVLKLDMQFFSGESHMDKGGNIIEAIMQLARSLGLTVIAEGVETEREANFLKKIHCHLTQGYLYGRPVSVDQFEELLKSVPVGEKRLILPEDSRTIDHYWEVERYSVLLRNAGASIFEYDPFVDTAIYTWVESGTIKRKRLSNYAKKLSENEHIPPQYRGWIREMQEHEKTDYTECEFYADYGKTGRYECYHADVYYYYSRNELTRVISIIKKKQ